MTWLVGCAFLEGLLPAASAWATKLMIDSLVDGGPGAAKDALTYGAIAGGLGAALPLIGHLQRYLEAQTRRALTITTQEHLFARLNRMWSLQFFEDPRSQDRLRLAERGGSEAPAQLLR